eukprot:TRINITY_DN23022_c0_g1_i2.p1 TRINITY_DN23022_c0_g1~~TRINITY_DN23022_c0_g1_i2.p1  ORF type:complete len:232 (+),score=44.03 TRINITY_DN23022_c0_g1_i2:97-696(+)
MFSMFFFFNDTATTEIYTRSIVGSVRCVQETDQRRVHGDYEIQKDCLWGIGTSFPIYERKNKKLNLLDYFELDFKPFLLRVNVHFEGPIHMYSYFKNPKGLPKNLIEEESWYGNLVQFEINLKRSEFLRMIPIDNKPPLLRQWKITDSVSYTHLRAHETSLHLVCRLLLEKKKKTTKIQHGKTTKKHTPTIQTKQKVHT